MWARTCAQTAHGAKQVKLSSFCHPWGSAINAPDAKKAAKQKPKAKPAKAKPPKASLWVRSPVLRWLKRIVPKFLLALAGLLLVYIVLVACLTGLYRFSWVHPYSTLMMADVVKRESFERDWVALSDMGSALPQSVIMSEDGQFCRHFGVDLGELKAVVEQALDGESPRGASTLTMQLAKNLFLWPSRSYARKVMELPLALMINVILPKSRQMEIYLNIAEWGDGYYGAGAGAKKHFNRQPQNLTRKQAALMTVALPNPYLRNPAKPSRGMVRIAGIVEKRARASGAYIGCLKPE